MRKNEEKVNITGIYDLEFMNMVSVLEYITNHSQNDLLLSKRLKLIL